MRRDDEAAELAQIAHVGVRQAVHAVVVHRGLTPHTPEGQTDTETRLELTLKLTLELTLELTEALADQKLKRSKMQAEVKQAQIINPPPPCQHAQLSFLLISCCAFWVNICGSFI